MGLLTQKQTGEWQIDVTELLEFVDELRDGEKRIGQAMRLLLTQSREVARKKYEKAVDTYIDTIRDDEKRFAEFEGSGYKFLFFWAVSAWDLWEYRSTEHLDSCKFRVADYMAFLLESFEKLEKKKEACTCH